MAQKKQNLSMEPSLDDFIKSIPSTVFKLDEKRKIIQYSDELFLGFPFCEVQGEHISSFLVKENDASFFNEGFFEKKSQDIWFQGNKEKVLYDYLSFPLENDDIYMGTLTDITRFGELLYLKRNEAAIRAGFGAASAIHDVKNMLAPLALTSEFIRMLTDEEKIKEHTTTMCEIISNLSDTISRKMDYIQSGKFTFETTNLKTSLRSMINLLQKSYPHQQIQIVCNYDPHIPLMQLARAPMESAFYNILSNAAEAISTQYEQIISINAQKNNDLVTIVISDNGPGIDPSLIENELLFTFGTTTKVDGHGYGLAGAKDTIYMHKGFIEAYNNETGGATFKITLPIFR